MATDDDAVQAGDVTDEAERHGVSAWQGLGRRLRGIPPNAVARGVLVVGAAVALGWLGVITWPALLPFVVGGVIAYAVLPLVNALDRFLPRALAATVTTLAALLFLVLVVALLVGPLIAELVRLLASAQNGQNVRALTDQLNGALNLLPGPLRDAARSGVQQGTTNVGTRLNAYVSGVTAHALQSFFGLINLIGALFGLLVLPVWMLLVLRDERAAVRTINRVLPGWLEGDFWAVLRIVDRAFGVFIRGLVVQGVAAGALTYAGFYLLSRGNLPASPFPVVLAVFTGLMQLIPTVGPILATILATLIGLTASPRTALAVLVLYIVVAVLVNKLVASRIQSRVIDVHPAILALALVALSQLGLVWVLFAAPILAVARDLFLYAYGRFGNPAQPAGVLPGTAASATGQAASAAQPARVPLVYRRMPAS